MFFKSNKTEIKKEDSSKTQDLAIITQMNQEFATSLDLNETLQTALEVIIKRLNAQAANIFLIDEFKRPSTKQIYRLCRLESARLG